MTDASTTGAVERLIERLMLNTPVITQDHMDAATEIMPQASRMIRALVAERDAAIQRAEAAERAEAAAWNDAIEAVEAIIDGKGYLHTDDIRALRRAAPTGGEAQSLDDTTRAVLDRAERIVAGQSQQEQRTAEIFLRPTEGEA